MMRFSKGVFAIVIISALTLLFQNCSGQMASLSTQNSNGTPNVLDPDGNGSLADAAIENVTINPGDLARIPIALSQAPADDLSYSFSTIEDTALAGQHFVPVTGAGTINAGSTSGGFSVQTNNTPGLVYLNRFFRVRIQIPDLRIDKTIRITFGAGAPSVNLANVWLGATSNAPEARRTHTAVWTGTKMIVWGGIDGKLNSNLIHGLSYDLATDQWSQINSINPPPARARASAVWTGSKIIYWGGYWANQSHNDGYIYDPATNVWTVMSAAGAPSPRYGHTAVWTGSKMIVWGGTNGSFVNDGWIYDPAANTWTVMTAPDAPSGRSLHTAVWTGSKMIIWGGSSGVYASDGWIFDPAANTWTMMTATGAPGGRNLHTAVWTGSKMIVWGGYQGATNYPTDGAAFDPVANTWTPISNSGASGPRIDFAAVWADSKMIVFGGYRYPNISLSDGVVFH